jgi:hypothetical protein
MSGLPDGWFEYFADDGTVSAYVLADGFGCASLRRRPRDNFIEPI